MKIISPVKCTYEAIIPFKRVPYWVFWPVVGLVGYALSEIAVNLLAEGGLLATRLIVCLVFFGFWPTAFIWLFYAFRGTMLKCSAVLWTDDPNFENWLTDRQGRIFTLRRWPVRLFILVALVLGLSTLVGLGLPFRSSLLNGLLLIGVALAAIVGFQGTYMVLDLMATLGQLVKRPARLPFFYLPHPAITQLQKYYTMHAGFVVVAYILGVIAVWLSPYSLQPLILAWLSILAISPLLMLFWSFFLVRGLINRLKQAQIEAINRQIQTEYQKIVQTDDPTAPSHLKDLMEIQTKIIALPEWPLFPGGRIAIVGTVGTVLFQGAVSVYKFFNPS